MNKDIEEQLQHMAIDVAYKAYAPYSKFLVGAALLTPSGDIFTGCNVENASYGLTICAERAATCAMVANGQREIQAVAIASRGAVTPCGACRQFLAEFGMDFTLLLIDSDQRSVHHRWTMRELLPGAFHLAAR